MFAGVSFSREFISESCQFTAKRYHGLPTYSPAEKKADSGTRGFLIFFSHIRVKTKSFLFKNIFYRSVGLEKREHPLGSRRAEFFG